MPSIELDNLIFNNWVDLEAAATRIQEISELARVLERHPRVISYVKNQGMAFEAPYRDGAVPRKYIPDFIVRLEDGRGEPLNLILETKGFRGIDAQHKAQTMQELWVPGVNNLGAYGRWAFHELRDGFAIQDEFDALVEEHVASHAVLV